MTTFIKDSQSRTTQYGIKCFQMIDGLRCQAFAHAKKKGTLLVVSETYSYCIDDLGNSLNGNYKILSVGVGNLAPVECEKILN